MAIKSTYPQTITRNGKKYHYVAKTYGSTAIQRGAGTQVLKDEAKREREKGNETIVIKKKDVGWGAVGSAKNVDYIYFLYARPKAKKKKGRK